VSSLTEIVSVSVIGYPLMELAAVMPRKKSKKAKKQGGLVNDSGIRLSFKGVQSLTKMPQYAFRQLCYPSATTFTVSGTGATYSATTGVWSPSTSAVSFWSLYFRFGDLPQASTTLGPLADQYKIERVLVHILPSFNVSAGPSSLINLPYFTVADYDDSSVLTTINQAFEYQNCQVHEPYKKALIEIVPRIAVPSGTGFVNRPPDWIDMADQTVQHYGLKGAVGIQTGGCSYTIVCEYHIRLRSIK